MLRKLLPLAAVLATIALPLSACGDDDGETVTVTTQAAPATTSGEKTTKTTTTGTTTEDGTTTTTGTTTDEGEDEDEGADDSSGPGSGGVEAPGY
jgi:hypothetical protein